MRQTKRSPEPAILKFYDIIWYIEATMISVVVRNAPSIMPAWSKKLFFCFRTYARVSQLTHWGRVTHRCVGKLISIGSDNGLSPDWRQDIIWTNAGISLIGPLGTNFSEILIKIHTLSLKKMHLKVSSAKRRPFCLGLNELTNASLIVYLALLARLCLCINDKIE